MEPFLAIDTNSSGRHGKIMLSVSCIIFKIETVKLDFKEKAKPKIGSKDLIDHKAGGGDKKVGIFSYVVIYKISIICFF